MDRGLAVLLTAVVGGMLATQGPINSALGKAVGTFQGAFVSFATGTIVLAVIAGLVRGGYGQIAEIRTLVAAVPGRRPARRLLRLDGRS